MSKFNKRGSRKTFIWKSLSKSLIGKKIHVIRSSSKEWEGIEGVILDETFHMLKIQCEKKAISIPKSEQLFELEINDDLKIQIEGHLLEGYPEHRIKRKLKNW